MLYWRKGKTSDGTISPEERFLLERYVHVRRGVFIWLLTMAFLSPFLMSIAGFAYTNHVQQNSAQQWCGTLNAIDYEGRPIPAGPTGEVLRNIRVQRHKYGCDQK